MPNSNKALSATISNVQRVRRRLTDGTMHMHFYHRPTKIRLPSPNDPSFTAAYKAAEQQLEMQQSKEPGPTTLPTPVNNYAHESFVEKLPAIEPTPISNEAEAVRYLTPQEVSSRWRNKITPETLANWRTMRLGPPYNKFGKAILYRLDLLEKWEQKNLIGAV
jgi:hypothetical protein